jgi:para-aminobenzoate synthetase component 1
VAGFEAVECFNESFELLSEKTKGVNDWLLGYFSYDLKNEFEHLSSKNPDLVGFPLLCFFVPRYVVVKEDEKWRVEYLDGLDSESSIRQWLNQIENAETAVHEVSHNYHFSARTSKEEYIRNVKSIQQHIIRGDIYEMNYCVEFYGERTEIDPVSVYSKLIEVSPVPFASLLRFGELYLLSASPERYLRKSGSLLFSQPIKGTSPRKQNKAEDELSRDALANSVKEQSENVMITDLVRNDLSRVAQRGSVKVDELCAIYPFRQVFQMISTISAQMEPQNSWLDAIRATFPMGSMTGAPKVKAMELIDEFETTRRGIYSGAVGYVTPDGDFDFNVVIRSVAFNQSTGYLSFMVGSAITSLSEAEAEYDECLLKASAIRQVLGKTVI